ncbi:MAG: GspE/PulE family protein [Candidatus Peribacteraceae bacterium]
MPFEDDQLFKILLKLNYLSEEDAHKAEKEVKERGISAKQALMDMDLLTDELYESAIAEHFQYDYFDAQKTEVSADTIGMLPEAVARAYHCIAVERPAKSQVTIATSDPGKEGLEDAVRDNLDQEEVILPDNKKDDKKKKNKRKDRVRYTGKITWVYASQSVIENMMAYYRKPLETRFQQIIDEQKKVAPEILQEIFNDAIQLNASDIHFEPIEQDVVVRFRVDGVLHEAGRIPKEFYEGVLNRIKIAGNMHIDEHLAAQDGAIRYKAPSGMKVDMRVSVIPVVDGEKVALRLLSEYVHKLSLGSLGFTDANRLKMEQAARKPFGMILVTGPTGSGKSTTLYTLLKMRNTPDVNISTVEDPVEYKIQGVNHIQKNDETGLTFANGLRALMRQDPDILLVGEIRDGETADIAVNAALTGHLLFSTLHANTAATGIPRLLEMGVEPFLLASTLEVIVGQRLLRRICPKCRYSYSLSSAELQKLYPAAKQYFTGSKKHRLFKGKGCSACSNTGYAGRTGIHELVVITPEIQELIVQRASSNDIEDLARQQGMQLMFEDGLEKVRQGFTTIEELMRVASPPQKQIKKTISPRSHARKSK